MPLPSEIKDPPATPRQPPCRLSSAKRFPPPGGSIKAMFAQAAKRKQEAQGGEAKRGREETQPHTDGGDDTVADNESL